MGGARLSEEDDKLIFILNVYGKMSFDNITDKFGWSADAIRGAKRRYLDKIQESGAEILEPEGNIGLIVKARAGLNAILGDPKHPDYVNMIKYVLTNIDSSFMKDKGLGKGKNKKDKGLMVPDRGVKYLEGAVEDGVFDNMVNTGSVINKVEEVIRGE